MQKVFSSLAVSLGENCSYEGEVRMQFRHCLVLLFVFFGASCGLTEEQKKGVHEFGDSAEAVAKVTSAALPELRDLMIELNAAFIDRFGIDNSALPKEKQKTTLLAQDGMPYEFYDLDGVFTLEAVKEYISAAEGLAAYGGALVALADYDAAKPLSDAAAKLTKSLQGVKSGGTQLIDDKTAKGLGDLVRIIGSIFLEAERKSAIRELVQKADPIVAKLTVILQRAMSPLPFTDPADMKSKDGFASAVRRRLEKLKEDLEPLIRENRTGLGVAREYQQVFRGFERLGEIHGKASKALEKVKKAHGALHKLVHDNSFDAEELIEVGKMAAELVSAASALGG